MTLPRVSVIVPVYNDEGRIAKCIDALLNQTYPIDRYEVLVVDNGSTDRTRDVIARYPVQMLVEDSIQSSYAARNLGVAKAKGEILAFTDSDCIPACDWIEKGVDNLIRAPGCGLVGGKIEIFCKVAHRPNAVELYDSVLGLRQDQHIKRNYGATANVFTYRKVFDHVGPFKHTLRSGGDSEWGRRVHSSGYNLYYAEDACVAHPARDSFIELYRRVTRLVGGNYSQRENNLAIMRVWLRGTRNTISILLRTVLGMYPTESLKGLNQRTKFVLVTLTVEVLRNYERARLILGGEPKR